MKQNTGTTMPLDAARVDAFKQYIHKEVQAGLSDVRASPPA